MGTNTVITYVRYPRYQERKLLVICYELFTAYPAPALWSQAQQAQSNNQCTLPARLDAATLSSLDYSIQKGRTACNQLSRQSLCLLASWLRNDEDALVPLFIIACSPGHLHPSYSPSDPLTYELQHLYAPALLVA